MSRFTDYIREHASRRDPPYRPALTIDANERADLDKKLGDAANYDLLQLREMVKADPGNIEFRKAMVSGIASAEYAGIDAFSRKVAEWQEWDVPWTLIMSIARQTWDEVRHARLATGVLESYGGKIGEYPDTLAGGAGGPPAGTPQAQAGARLGIQEPLAMLSAVNVSLEGGALTLFKETSVLGERIGDELLAHCYDYNWADEVTHTMIGDYFVRALCDDTNDGEQRALRAHAFSEFSRTRLDEQQTQELKDFFAEEMERASAALGTNGDAPPSTNGGYH
jgi:uncharacterized ferritin-like protein (DUF455 family)